jgi:energy-coupling factor transporter ATP-binding protein EcfA2
VALEESAGRLFDPGSARVAAIESIHVKDLHGKFTYDISVAPALAPSVAVNEKPDQLIAAGDDRLTLLYGNNGTGKTTLLRLLFHALSAAPNRGHRTALLRTRFAYFVVRLTIGVTVGYVRAETELAGPFTAILQRESLNDDGPEVIASWRYTGEPGAPAYQQAVVSAGQRYLELGAEGQFSYVGEHSYESDEDRFLRGLNDLAVNPVFLGDSRAIIGDVLSDDDVRQASRIDLLRRRAPDVDEILRRTRDHDVDQALAMVRSYLSQLALIGTQVGSQRVDTIYLNVASTIVQHAATVGRPKKSILPSLRDRVVELAARAGTFHTYGLLPEFPAEGLTRALDVAAERNGPLLERVLNPYLDGLEERMEALTPGLLAVSSIVDALNSFLERKHVNFAVGGRGLRILGLPASMWTR